MTNAISSISTRPTGVCRKRTSRPHSSEVVGDVDAGEVQKHDAPNDIAAAGDSEPQCSESVSEGAAQRVALARHRCLNTTALVLAMGCVCIPIYTIQRRGANHLPVWIAKAEAVAIALHLLQVKLSLCWTQVKPIVV